MAQFLPLFQVSFIFTKHLAIEPTNMLHERKSFKIQARDVHPPPPHFKKTDLIRPSPSLKIKPN